MPSEEPYWNDYPDLPNLTDEELLRVFSNHDHVSIEDLRNRIIPNIIETDGSLDYCGQSCDDDRCKWNGVDRRCGCSNNRVSWVCHEGGEYWYGEIY